MTNTPWTKIIRKVLAAFSALAVFLPSAQALAYCDCCDCICPDICCMKPIPKNHIQQAFNDYRKDFIMDSFYKNQWEDDGLKPKTDQLRDVIITNAMMIGAFLDGYAANAALTNLQSLNANAMRDYQVSDSVCKIGSLSRSIAASESRTVAQQLVMSEIGLARNLGTSNSIASTGRGRDNQSRLFSFVEYFCDNPDNNDGLGQVCKAAGALRDVEFNRDIDFARTIDDRPTLNFDLTDGKLNRDEKDVIHLGHMLYGHRQDTKRPSASEIESSNGVESYAMTRSIVARRDAAQNTYNVITAMKASGGDTAGANIQVSYNHVLNALKGLGLGGDDLTKYSRGYYIGVPKKAPFDDVVMPSYNLQMDVLTRRLYQNPAFYTNLMDTKANVKRISSAMGGISLAQDRDIYRSVARSEMLLALLLSLESRQQGEEASTLYNEDIKQQQ